MKTVKLAVLILLFFLGGLALSGQADGSMRALPLESSAHSASAVQNVQLNAGWNLISSYIDPTDPQLDTLLAGILPNLLLLKDGSGGIYWPDLGTDTIGSWDVNQGYQVYMTAPALLEISGEPVTPGLLSLPAGWNILPYHQETAASAADVLADYSQVLVLAVNGTGAIYWPEYGVDQIGAMQPGQGYRIYFTQTTLRNTPPRIVTGSISFQKEILATDVRSAHAVVAADLDRDGDIDAAVTDSWHALVKWFRNDGSGNFTELVVDYLDQAYPMSVGDVDQDGHPDLMAGGYASDSFVWYRNEGNGNFSTHLIGDQTDGAHSIVNGDLDEDGDMDFITSSQDAGIVAWYENDGALNFSEHVIDTTALGAKRADTADINGDGDIDIISGSYDANEVAWHENDGSEQFTKHVIQSNALGTYYVFPADIDGDEDVDIFAALMEAHKIVWYKNDGSGSFSANNIDTNVLNPRTVLGVDIDLDGNVDALTASVGDNTVAWYSNNGSGVFSKHVIDDSALAAYSVFAIDVDFDGDMDVFAATRDGWEVILYHHIRAHSVVIGQGTTLVFSSSHLLTVDDEDGPTDLTYTLTAVPLRGNLLLNGNNLALGSTFTQADINDGRLSYQHTAATTTADNFAFEIADGGEWGVQPAAGTFRIRFN